MEKHKGWIRYTKKNKKVGKPVGIQLAKEIPKHVDDTHLAIEQTVEMLKDWDKEIWECINNGKKHFTDDFYIEVLLKSDRALDGYHISTIFVARSNCPDPFYDQTVYKYIAKTSQLKELWHVPDYYVCQYYANNFNGKVPIEDYDMYMCIKHYYDGTYHKIQYKEKYRDRLPIQSIVEEKSWKK